MKHKLDLPDGDDGYVIANMNVPGMPWYKPKKHLSSVVRPALSGNASMTPEERRQYTIGAVAAALVVTLVMCLGIVLFTLFCLYIWFPH